MADSVTMQSDELHPLVSLLSAFFWVILWLLTWVKALVAFITISIPRFIYFVLSYSMTLTLNFWSFAIMFVLSAVALNYFIRFRYLNVYSDLKEPPLVKPDVNELHPDVNTTEPPPAFHNYLDDFLQAVRVFGFLEKPVFHELARHLQTKRLIAGDSISMDQDRSFYCVVEGNVQVFAKTGQAIRQNGSWEEDDMNGYQLINVVGNGGTLSSLFSILSLFTEDIPMTWRDDINSDIASESEHVSMPPRSRGTRHNSDVPKFDLDDIPPSNPRRSHAPSVSGVSEASVSTAHPFHSPGSQKTFSFQTASSHPSVVTPPEDDPPSQVHRGIVARAAEDTTLAVIPAEAFRRVTKKFPKATGHIVQVILTRFSRVTFNAAHKYLGLTTEVLRTEKAINELACHPLPASFYEGGGLHLLRQRFHDAEIHDSDSESEYFGRFTSPSPLESSVHLQSTSDFTSQEKLTGSPVSFPALQMSPAARTPAPRASASRHQVQAGDLHTSAQNDIYRSMTRSFSVLNTPRIPSTNMNPPTSRLPSGDEFDLREEVMSCIAKSIGLLQPPMSGIESPALPPFDPNRSPGGTLPSPFGSLSLLDSVSVSDSASSFTTGSTNTSSYMSGLDNEVEILYFSAGSTLVKAGERNTGLYYVIEGFLDILLPVDENKAPIPTHAKNHESDSDSLFTAEPKPETESTSDRKLLFTVKPGGIAGYLASLCGTSSYVDIQAKTDTYVGFLSAAALERLMEKRPIVLLTLAKRLISLLSPLVLQIDASLDWMQVSAGQVLWRPDDVSDSFYIVINGRLRSISEEGRKTTIRGEFGQGDTVGELDVMTGSPRTTTVHAIRDSELIRMPQTLFNAISSRNPQTTAQLLKMIASRIRREVDSAPNVTTRNTSAELGKNNTNLKTVAVLPVSRSVPIDVFARKLKASLEGIGARTSLLNQASVSTHLGRHAFTRMGKLKAAAWLADQEQRYRIVLYVADSPVNSQWTQTCIRQADFVMVVGMGDDPSLGEYERLLLTMKTTARKELVLLHPDRSVVPGSTREWLKSRHWIHQHIHVELPGLVVPITKPPPQVQDPGAVAAFKNLKDRVQSGIQKYRGSGRHGESRGRANKDDFARLARRLCGKSIGVVLGGGGARGLSHLGLIRALEEHDIPIDYIGGTSIGSFIGGLYARECDIIMSTSRARQFSSRMGNVWRMLSDVTYPLVAYTTGHEFNRTIYKAFYDLHIEDMWLPYFCNTTNINTSSMEIHDSGYAWRFIRASMTLVGLLPPLCDNGNMLVDGGYIDNLPVATMFSKGASIVFAADVGSIDDNSPRNFGDSVSGWWLLVNRWNPFSSARTVPAITEIQSRLAYVSSVRTLEEAKVASSCFYMQMPVQEYGTLQFSKIDEIEKKGYAAAMQFLEDWKDEGKLPASLVGGHEGGKAETSRKGRSARRNSI
ncbi:patatin-domain-containing protein [Coniophora puteana RWD-64-598 SS2]|uniref:Lysophospholipase NTE1 n=1 Tax=Coniophora puteana (strain RWD-64-598) TaxID=741705 RepID=A0A5M3N8F5_CONPW|nr:patatin-domain-containing protein [Coniophora puteana RWD-64-598 SS2]EIW87141.1 patatin-domain-containing protein [Coniophora puteana RWD-64-598 SS2]